jgi:hypothetical protein
MTLVRLRGFQSVMAAIIAITLAFMATPVEACGCGIYIPLEEGEASVSEEHVLIRWDGKTEDIVMTLGVLGSSKEAAVIFPVPTRAKVKLADAKVFETLQKLTEPKNKYDFNFIPVFGGAGGPPPSVTLLERQAIGPFDVSTLAATDANALGNWLADNGYNLSPEITRALEPYVEQDWYYIAVRLSPESDDGELTGALDPLWITFTYTQIVYPMRPSALARDTFTVFMYVLADHRVQKTTSFGYSDVQYAGWIDPDSLEADSPLAPFVSKKLFLTKIVEQIYQPETINDDYFFEFAPVDDLYRDVKYVDEIGGFPLCFVVPCGVPLLFIGSVLILIKWFKKNRQARSNV